MFTVAASNFFTKKLYAPLSRIGQRINLFIGAKDDRFQKNLNLAVINSSESNDFLELQALEVLLQKTLQLIQEKNATEQELVQIAEQAAHDICSPIVALNLALQKIPNISDEQRKYVKNIEKSITTIAKELMHKYDVIKNKNTLITLPLINEQKESPINIAIVDLVTNIAEQKKPLLEKNNIKLTLNIQQNTHNIYVLVNPDLMQRALSNIIDNAIDAIININRKTDERTIDIILEKSETIIVITIKDNGCGMPSELIEKIGQYKLTLGKKGGHGLGLYSAIQNIRSWHGTFNIISKPTIGTQFKIYLPIAQEGSAAN